ncbi:MAG: Dihydrolipoyl dehydrogenase [Clostridia bacterium 62_21]|nr:MAG: Dihydrolipoyl dehydrogenase [Clostridia bacterium 62_21]
MRYDLIVIGAGAAGLSAAVAGALHGTVALVEAEALGGGYVRRDVPAAFWHRVAGPLYGARCLLDGPMRPGDELTFAALAAQRDAAVRAWRVRAERILAEMGVEILYGRGRVLAPGLVGVDGGAGEILLVGENIIVATGTYCRSGCGGGRMVALEEALALRALPCSAVVAGSDAPARTLALVLAVWGIPVHLVAEGEGVAAVRRLLEGAGVRVHAGAVTGICEDEAGVTVRLADGTCLRADVAVVDVPGVPATAGLGLEELGVAVAPGGTIAVNARMETSVPGVFAAGRAAGAPSTQTAVWEGLVAAYNACGWPLVLRAEAAADMDITPFDAAGFYGIVSVDFGMPS